MKTLKQISHGNEFPPSLTEVSLNSYTCTKGALLYCFIFDLPLNSEDNSLSHFVTVHLLYL